MTDRYFWSILVLRVESLLFCMYASKTEAVRQEKEDDDEVFLLCIQAVPAPAMEINYFLSGNQCFCNAAGSHNKSESQVNKVM